MRVGVRLISAGLVALVFAALPAGAKECKNETISATSRKYISRSLGAFPSSWAAWRKKVKGKIGNGWQAWRRAEDRKIQCEQVENDNGRKRWTCMRTARPCRLGSATNTARNNNKNDVWHVLDLVPIDTVLRRGMNGDQVKTLQYLLSEAGHEVDIDGDFGASTEIALRRFQQQNDLTVDGRAGPKTVEALTS